MWGGGGIQGGDVGGVELHKGMMCVKNKRE